MDPCYTDWPFLRHSCSDQVWTSWTTTRWHQHTFGPNEHLIAMVFSRDLNCGHLLIPRIMTSKSGCLSTTTHSPTLEYVTHIWTLMNSKPTARHCCNPHSCIRDLTFFPWSNGLALSDFPLFSKRQQTDEGLECPLQQACRQHE